MEFQEAMLEIKRCYENDGFTVTYDAYGFETVESLTGSGDPMEQMTKCAFADGGVVALFYMMLRNPDNVSEEVLITECLIRVGVVEPGFSSQEFERVMQTGETPWDEDDVRVRECFKNPLGL